MIGWGIQPKPKIDGEMLGLSDEWQRIAQREFMLWANNTMCDAERQQNFFDLQQLAFRSQLVSGDVFALFGMKPNARTPYQTTIRILEADRICTPESSGESKSKETDGGGRIIDGVEIDKEGAVIRYHIANRHPLLESATEQVEWQPIDAYGKDTGYPNILHIMTLERPEQRRGISFVAAQIEQIKQLDRYLNSELAANVVSSMLTAFIVTADDDGKTGLEDAVNEDEKVTDDDMQLELAPGAIYSLPPGKKIQEVNPIRSNSAFLENLILNEGYSPAAALGEIKRSNLQFQTTICEATLYSYIRKGIFLNLEMKHLPRRGQKKQKHEQVKAKKAPRGESIERRPEEINDREEPGDWEMDTVVGCKHSKKTLLVMTERKMRKEIIIRMPDKTAASTVKALNKLERKFGKLFPVIFKSITVDNGSEFADCAGMERSIRCKGSRTKIYYCHPYSAYERGSNENQNLLIHRFFPKGTSFDKVAIKYIQHVENWINKYPRKILGFKSADDLFDEWLCTLTV